MIYNESTLIFNSLKELSLLQLKSMHSKLDINKSSCLDHAGLVKSICCDHHVKRKHPIKINGLLEIIQDGFGFLRLKSNQYIQSTDDAYVSPLFVKKLMLQTGDEITAYVKVNLEKSSYLSTDKILEVNGVPAEEYQPQEPFDSLTPLHPQKMFSMEMEGSKYNILGRLTDIVSPIGSGQRGLIVSPPRSGKTTILRYFAEVIKKKYSKVHLIVLLIGERPEEVTEFKLFAKNCPNVEVISSTFDESAFKQIQITEMVLARAKKMVENKRDVVILLDSLTRLVRAYNEVSPGSGRVLSGGLEAQSLQLAKRFFGAARSTLEAGNLTILASVLIETGSKMDEVIFEEFKGTGNMELHLSRKSAEKYVFPAINLKKSGTRRDELMVSKATWTQTILLRRILHDQGETEAIEFLINRLNQSDNNSNFFLKMKKG